MLECGCPFHLLASLVPQSIVWLEANAFGFLTVLCSSLTAMEPHFPGYLIINPPIFPFLVVLEGSPFTLASSPMAKMVLGAIQWWHGQLWDPAKRLRFPGLSVVLDPWFDESEGACKSPQSPPNSCGKWKTETQPYKELSTQA